MAHGCASTLVTLARSVRDGGGPARARAWGVALDRLPAVDVDGPQRPERPGNCWFRPTIVCPFSVQGQDANAPPPDPQVRAMIADIYARCGRPETHQRT